MPKLDSPKSKVVHSANAHKISLPKISLPKISLPKISLPKISLPKISLPKISLSNSIKLNRLLLIMTTQPTCLDTLIKLVLFVYKKWPSHSLEILKILSLKLRIWPTNFINYMDALIKKAPSMTFNEFNNLDLDTIRNKLYVICAIAFIFKQKLTFDTMYIIVILEEQYQEIYHDYTNYTDINQILTFVRSRIKNEIFKAQSKITNEDFLQLKKIDNLLYKIYEVPNDLVSLFAP